MAEQDFSEIARLSEKYARDPKSRIFVQLADAYRKNNMIDEALEVLNQGLEHHPQYALAHLILGKCYYDRRMYAQAKASLEKTIGLDVQNIVALRMLAQICETMKDEEGQAAAYRGILAVDPLDAMARDRLAALEAGMRKGPVITISLAQEYERQGNLAEALKLYEQLSYTDPTDLVVQERIRTLRQRLSGAPAEPSPAPAPAMSEVELPPAAPPEPEPAPPAAPQEPASVMGMNEFLLGSAQMQTAPVTEAPPPPPPVTAPEEPIQAPPEAAPEAPRPMIGSQDAAGAPVEAGLIEPVPEPPPVYEAPPTDATHVATGPAPESADIQTLDEFLIQEEQPAPESAPGPEPLAAQEIEQELPPLPETPTEPEISPPPPQTATAPGAEPAPEPTTEKPAKPKEEDFKSFQDWLSTLLK